MLKFLHLTVSISKLVPIFAASVRRKKWGVRVPMRSVLRERWRSRIKSGDDGVERAWVVMEGSGKRRRRAFAFL
jgi:hypothetical protein